MAVFHPLKHTLARRERGIAGRKRKRQTEETVGGVLLLKHTPARLIPISCSLAAPLADMEHSENRLRLFTATLLFSFFLSFFPISPVLMRSYLPRSCPDRPVRLKQRAEDTARILGCIGIRKGTCSFILSRSQLEWPPRKEATSPTPKPLDKSHPSRIFFKHS